MNLRVLIVEDEIALAEILEYNFKKEGYTVDTALDGEIALDKIIFKAPDLIILDWMLPKLSGMRFFFFKTFLIYVDLTCIFFFSLL